MKKLVWAAFLGVIAIWSITPLAINRSLVELNFGEAMFWRNLTASVVVLLVMMLWRFKPVFNKAAWRCYLIGGFQLYGAMTLVYVGASYVGSGTVAVFHGIIPVIAAISSWLLVRERQSTYREFFILLSLIGLALVFKSEWSLDRSALIGLIALSLAVTIHGFCSSAIKKYNQNVKAIDQMIGSLLISLPGYGLNAIIWSGHSPSVGIQTVSAILWLAIFGSILGFILYFYLLQRLSSVIVGMISVVSPVFSLLIGVGFNQEKYGLLTYIGSVITLVAVAFFLLEPVFKKRIQLERIIKTSS